MLPCPSPCPISIEKNAVVQYEWVAEAPWADVSFGEFLSCTSLCPPACLGKSDVASTVTKYKRS